MGHGSTDLLRGFEARDLDPATFDHAAHVRAAFEMLEKYEFMEATSKYAANIHAMATKAGAAKKFNMTITIAFMSIIALRMETGHFSDFEGFIAANDDLLSKDIVGQWYSPERLKSDKARKIFLMPDRGLA